MTDDEPGCCCDETPAPLVAGAIGRSLSDAQAAYVERLKALESPRLFSPEQSPEV